eukprot:TRINITY_DN8398_c0_g1_i1.p1 TRINITY_DN8398_c0_g1~~TRINITY_DN8398_c0_g1_i1.p1  ORF type:complete len:108 (-),score=2.49 TRINITY_DN8398_c0_g1_i1:56-379(-)
MRTLLLWNGGEAAEGGHPPHCSTIASITSSSAMFSSSGVWTGSSGAPSNKNRTSSTPCLLRHASISFLRGVQRRTLKKTSDPSEFTILSDTCSLLSAGIGLLPFFFF